MEWLDALTRLRAARQAGVIVTVASVRGHAPRASGAKMVVSSDDMWGTVGGGNLEVTAIEHARGMIARNVAEPDMLTLQLSDKAPAMHGVQCCGGEVTMLLEPIRVIPAVAVFGIGHVGLELARVLVRHDIELHLIDSRASMVAEARLRVLQGNVATLRVHHTPAPESVVNELPPGTHLLIMTHDHAEDMVLCDTALRRRALGSIGLIGSSAKWSRFRVHLLAEGHTDAELERIQTPIGIRQITSKDPAAIAVSVAAELLRLFERSDSPATTAE
ncbi:xanthine dehydrogenase accessory protein XdhC [Cryobacterium psychrophilum]|uniref:Xanthine dehydrogenase accessory protein XdhC n=1 Tax=Cryobacterium psychrophilum TaxID=41988 RepID=A0A4Y8KMD1_9MICO|nr:xanthine dehydrogenase accessory protein XdhC [Cryobacterium psychrophilum]TDW30189.1 molybdenum cofactor sulfurylase [Cryobacterium psychrophilum]TFD77417.1 xanthine dehydrogenase accessory protein XdhC [Cryobacterium psychrophilum]